MDPSELRLHAAALANALEAADIGALDKRAIDALDRVFSAVTYTRREALAARKQQLWRIAAVKVPVDVLANLQRTEIIDGDVNPDLLGSMALVLRTDTGLFYLVSTNDEETLTVLSDCLGRWPEHSGAASVLAASGRGLTRASALEIIDRTDALVTDGERARWHEDD